LRRGEVRCEMRRGEERGEVGIRGVVVVVVEIVSV